MKKNYLILSLLCLFGFGKIQAQDVLLNEDFESLEVDKTGESGYNEILPPNWSTIDSYDGNDPSYRWNSFYSSRGVLGGTICMTCDAPVVDMGTKDGMGPREEILLTPELALNDSYELSFRWKSASAAVFDNKALDFEVRVTEDNGDTYTTLWAFTNKEQLKESGVMEFPWTGWKIYESKIDLSAFKGKTVKVAFAYKLLKKLGNVVYIDDVRVKQFTPKTQPQIQCNKRSYNFGELYIGAKRYSEVITLKNTGTNGLTISEVKSDNKDFTTNIVKEDVNLDKNESYQFQVIYEPTLYSKPNGTIEIVSNGGTATLQVKGTKLIPDQDYTYEGFEGDVFPPIGWTINHKKAWNTTPVAFSGDKSAYTTISLEGNNELITPRLDLSQGEHKIIFNCFEEFVSETGELTDPENAFRLEFSKDAGQTWKVVWENSVYNEIVHAEVDLGAPASNNCYIKWMYGETQVELDNIPETSIVFIDDVVLPPLYGRNDKPAATNCIAPADGAKDIYNKGIELKWTETLFAEAYKLYVGTSANSFEVVNGEVVQENKYTLASLNYGQTYFWKVVPYNTVGEAASCPTWSFTIITDQTVSEYPWTEDFEGNVFPPLGWRVVKAGFLKWDVSEISPYDGKRSAYTSASSNEAETILETHNFKLSDNEDLEIAFYWGNHVPVALKKDPTGIVQNETTQSDGIDAGYFEIFANGKWKTLKMISNKNDLYWFSESVDLKEYRGQTVSFRWRYVVEDVYDATGMAVDNVIIRTTSDNSAVFNIAEWNAGDVNFQKSVSTEEIYSIINNGTQELTIKEVAFGTEHFETTLQAGTTIQSKRGVLFGLTFHAGTASEEISDVMTVTFENGFTAQLNVRGNALAEDIRYFNFESDEAGSTKPLGFTTIDVDHMPSIYLTGLTEIPHYGEAYAFMVMPDDAMNHVCKPVSGKHVLCAMSLNVDAKEADDWLVSSKMKATADSKFRFSARNWESVNSIMPANRHKIEVLVSTTSNTDTKAFETVMEREELPYYNGKTYENFSVDLSQYAGQEIYVALRHTVIDGLAAFFDDFYFEHFESFDDSGIEKVEAEGIQIYPNPACERICLNGVEDAELTLTTIDGAVVRRISHANQMDVSDLPQGFYLLTIKAGEQTTTVRLIKK